MAPKIMKTCPECGNRFPQTHHRQQFCIAAHGRAYNARVMSEGISVMGLAKAWRAARSQSDPALREAGKEAFILLCRQLDASNSADRDAGRLHPTRMYLRRQAAGLMDHAGALARRVDRQSYLNREREANDPVRS